MFQYSDKIFFHGQAITGLCNMLVMQLQKVVTLSSPDILEYYCTIMVEALTFGPVHRRDQRSVIRHASAYFVIKLSFMWLTLLAFYRSDAWSLVQRTQRLCLVVGSRGEYIDLKQIKYRDSRKLHDEEFHNFSCLCNTVRLNNTRGMRWILHIACLGKTRNPYKLCMVNFKVRNNVDLWVLILNWILEKQIIQVMWLRWLSIFGWSFVMTAMEFQVPYQQGIS